MGCLDWHADIKGRWKVGSDNIAPCSDPSYLHELLEKFEIVGSCLVESISIWEAQLS